MIKNPQGGGRIMYVNNKNSKHVPLQQGTIINGCITEYYNRDVWGVIITPRCDIDNGGKVSTIHYLPIVSLEDWMKVDCISIATDKLRKKVKTLLDRYQISENILVHIISQDDFALLLQDLSKKERHMAIALYNTYVSVIKNKDYSSSDFKKLCDEELKELCKGKNNRFYLIKHWDSTDQYNVIILRDVRKISLNLALKFVNGYRNNNLSEEAYYCNDLFNTEQKLYFKTITQIVSPYIEHIIQAFSHNFCRIGVENLFDHETIIKNYKKQISQL